jgi:hypothetical protein
MNGLVIAVSQCYKSILFSVNKHYFISCCQVFMIFEYVSYTADIKFILIQLGGVVVSVLVTGPKACGFKPG